MLFAIVAEEAKLEAVALMSQWNPHPTHPSAVTREHWLANNIYRWMPSVGVIHINPGLFAFLYLLSLPMIVHLGMLPGPYGDGRNAPPSNEDIGRVAAGVLADPAPHIGKSYRPTGPELLSPQDIAEILTGVVGRKVEYQDVSLEMFLKAATAQGVSHFRYREHPSATCRTFVVERLPLGRPRLMSRTSPARRPSHSRRSLGGTSLSQI